MDSSLSVHPGQHFRSHRDCWSNWSAARTSGKTIADTHHGMEINFVEDGRVTYLFGGNILTLPAWRLVLFWGATPHRVIDYHKDTLHHWLEIPLATFLQWRFEDELVAQLMGGDVIAEPDPAMSDGDCIVFGRWHRDLESKSPQRCHIVALEVEARLRRLALSLSTLPKATAVGKLGAHQHVERMATYVAGHYTDPVRLADVAGEAHLRPDYATTLFRKVCGMSVMDYVTQHRLSHAKRLLLTTDEKVIDVAMRSGFGSSSRFYEAFAQWCGRSPRQYREMTLARQVSSATAGVEKGRRRREQPEPAPRHQ